MEVNGARRGALPGGDARHMLLQDSLLGALAVQVIWGLCWVASRTLGTLVRWTSGESLRVWTVDRAARRLHPGPHDNELVHWAEATRSRPKPPEAARSRPKPPAEAAAATGTIVQALSSAQGGLGEA